VSAAATLPSPTVAPNVNADDDVDDGPGINDNTNGGGGDVDENAGGESSHHGNES
jgi:hypothetical protein